MCADVSGRKPAVIMLKILGANVQNLVGWLTSRSEFAHLYSKVVSEVMVHSITVNKHINSELSFIVIILTRLEMFAERNRSSR